MGFLSILTSQLGNLLQSQSTARRLMMLLVVIGAVGGMIWLTIHANTGGYQVLYSNLESSDAVAAMSKLRQVGIDAQLENGNTTIKVPRTKADDAIVLLSMEGIPGSGTVGFELMDKTSLGQSKFQQEKNYNRMREGELARTLMSIREVETARVALALPEDSLFVQSEKKATASVVLKLRRGSGLDERQINGIIHLVSHSIEGLKPENVSIVDNMGNLLNPQRPDGPAQASVAQHNFKTQYEELIKSRIETMLENVIGRGKVSARVQADFDFATQHQVTESYNPDEQEPIIKTQKSMTEGLAGKGGAGVGAAGSDSNSVYGVAQQNQSTSSTATTLPGTRRSETTTDYVVSRKWSESEANAPKPMRISVAVLVDGNYVEVADAKGVKKQVYADRTPQELTNLESLIKAAIGFDDKRADQIQVQCAQFKVTTPPEEKETFLNSYPVRQYLPLAVQWGIVGLIGMLLIFMVLRPAMKQILVMPALARAARLTGPQAAALGQLSSAKSDIQNALTNNPRASVAGVLGSMPGIIGDSDEIDMTKLEAMLDQDMEDLTIPEELKDNQEAIRAFKLQHLAARQVKFSQAQTQQAHKEVLDTAKSNPQKTISLLRQWMEEA